MKELKPKFIIADADRRKSGFFKYILLIFIFTSGFCSGYFIRENQLADKYIAKTLDTDILYESFNDKLSNLKSYFNYNTGSIDYERKSPNITSTYESRNINRVSEKNENSNTEKSLGNKIKLNFINSQSIIKATGQKFTLQISAFETQKKTQDVVSQLLDKGYDAYSTISVNSRGDKWHLVRIGMYNSYDEALKKSEDLYKNDGINAEIEILEPPAVTKLSNFDLE